MTIAEARATCHLEDDTDPHDRRRSHPVAPVVTVSPFLALAPFAMAALGIAVTVGDWVQTPRHAARLDGPSARVDRHREARVVDITAFRAALRAAR